MKWSLQNFARATTAHLSWHVQKFVVIWWVVFKSQQHEFDIGFELGVKIVNGMSRKPFCSGVGDLLLCYLVSCILYSGGSTAKISNYGNSKYIWRINWLSIGSLWFNLMTFNTLRSGWNGHHFTDEIFRGIFLKGNICILIEVQEWHLFYANPSQ